MTVDVTVTNPDSSSATLVGGFAYVASDPNFADVASLLHFNGANGGTTFTDETGIVWTPETGVEISTLQSKFGGASGRFEVASKENRITTPSSASLNIGSQAFTVEGWFYITGTPTAALVFFAKDSNTSGREYSFRFTTSGGAVTGIQSLLFSSNSSFTVSNHSVSIPLNMWHHVAITRDALSNLRSFLNGTEVGSSVNSRSRAETPAAVSIGTDTFNSDPSRYQGFIDEFRFTVGTARYVTNFTPPTAPFPNS